MEQLAPERWPPGNRTGYCYKPSDFNKESNVQSCEMKYGNPFGPFWNEFNVEFDRSEFTGLTYSVEVPSVYKMWMDRYLSKINVVCENNCVGMIIIWDPKFTFLSSMFSIVCVY